ncbi:hypothetical protein [Rhodobaculum claviforme]|uniref:hypothetical protein n=1 Tax=Rhodobaculum claviforme TaxID=1549854 RepID=UPI0019112BDE|nr:hypothetical protein [Rhodobaculum claviforme]
MVLLGAAAFALSGCLGSSGSGGGGGVSAPAPGSLIGDREAPNLQTASELANEYLSEGEFDGTDGERIRSLLTAVAEAGGTKPTDPALLAGTASYAGDFALVIVDDFDDDASLLGDFAMSVNFDSGSLSGTLGREIIVDDGDRRTVAIGSGTINGTVTNNTMAAALTGAYTADGEAAQIDGRMNGQFVGAGGETVAGGMNAAVAVGNETAVFEGIFAGERSAP